MDKKSQELLNSLKNKKVGVFCDNANLYHAYQKYGWRVDFEKFRKFIRENMAWELRQCWHIYINRIKDLVEFRR